MTLASHSRTLCRMENHEDGEPPGKTEARRLIQKLNMSMDQVSRATGVHRSTVFRIVGDAPFAPSSRTLDKLRRAAGEAPVAPSAPPSRVAVILHQLPDGKARLQVDKVIPFNLALEILAKIEGAKE